MAMAEMVMVVMVGTIMTAVAVVTAEMAVVVVTAETVTAAAGTTEKAAVAMVMMVAEGMAMIVANGREGSNDGNDNEGGSNSNDGGEILEAVACIGAYLGLLLLYVGSNGDRFGSQAFMEHYSADQSAKVSTMMIILWFMTHGYATATTHLYTTMTSNIPRPSNWNPIKCNTSDCPRLGASANTAECGELIGRND
jgi:hypothetical protein